MEVNKDLSKPVSAEEKPRRGVILLDDDGNEIDYRKKGKPKRTRNLRNGQ